MKKKLIDPNIRNEEGRTLKWFLVLFYFISIAYDLSFRIISIYDPKFKNDNRDVLGLWIYLFMFALIPIAYYLFKRQKVYLIKYVYFITYTSVSLINEIISFMGDPTHFKTGNVVEVFWLLLSPVFVSTAFVKVVSAGLLLKYILDGIIIQSPVVLLPVLIVAIFSVLSFIILYRFKSYVKAIKTSYDQQIVGIVKGVIATLELKDPYTRGHSERVASYALELAKVSGKFSEDELKSFNYACLLHDIGKINIPDQILMKPGMLTNEEYEIIKSHTIVGAEAVSKVVGLKNSISVIRSHHERWDGKGYPDQLKGKEIPFLARISAIADAFDAMTSTRSYRSALSVEEANSRIIEGSGTQFDPELVEEYKKVLPKWKTIHSKLNDGFGHNNLNIHEEKKHTVRG
ncbi:HD-GYP domain-containing protein [Bacillus salipaludis]|uniref:HD-GYP domain-containing protein n=1 Tax=Bacillus salipaludis TaxID=2547811 RepID=UPI002E1CFB1C|nr:HD-GYP domain-containing protein [Bacillus salipaludis]